MSFRFKASIIILISFFFFSTIYNAYSKEKNNSKASKNDLITMGCGGFTTGNQYRALSEAEQLAYVSGAFDGIMVIPVSDAENKKSRIMRIVARTNGLQLGQLRAVVNKYLDEHPELWHMQMGILFYGAISNAFDPPQKNN